MATLPAGGRRLTPMPGGMLPGSVTRRSPAGPMTAPLLRSVGTLAAAAAVSSGLVLAWRRLAGGFTAADPGLAWMTLGAGMILLGITDAGRRAGGTLSSSLAARLGIVLAMAAVTLPPKAGDWVSVLALAVAAAAGVLPPPRAPGRLETRHRRRSAPTADDPGRRPGHATRGGTPSPATPHEPPPIAEPPQPVPASRVPAASQGRLQQRLERYESAEGMDCISGHVRLSIPAGGKATHAHVGFCPAFAATPAVEVSTDYDGVEAVVTAAEVLPWGVRIECRLSEPAEEPLEIPVDLVAQLSR